MHHMSSHKNVKLLPFVRVICSLLSYDKLLLLWIVDQCGYMFVCLMTLLQQQYAKHMLLAAACSKLE